MSPDPDSSAKVPILEHGEPGSKSYVKLIESGVIADYVDDTFKTGPRLWPSSPTDRAAIKLFNTAAGGISPWNLITGSSKADLQTALTKVVKSMKDANRCLEMYGK